MDCYIINMDRSTSRWKSVSEAFSRVDGLNVIRTPAIDGNALTLPHPDFCAWKWTLLNRTKIHKGAIGCSLSHRKALETFLSTDRPHAMVCEDDVVPSPELMDIVREAMRFSREWDLLRLSVGYKHPGRAVEIADLLPGFKLACDLAPVGGTGAMVVNRKAAETIVKKKFPVYLPYDAALFGFWTDSIREMSVRPFPVAMPVTETAVGSVGKWPHLHPITLLNWMRFPYRLIVGGARRVQRLACGMRYKLFPPKPDDPQPSGCFRR